MKRARVLLADSHKVVLEGLRNLMEHTFEIVGMVEEAQSVLEAAEALKPDIAVVDLSMQVSGANIVRHLKNRHPQVKVIMLSVHDEPTAVGEALATGASAFVLKRSAASDLIPAMREVLAGRGYVSPGIRGQSERRP